MDAFFASIKADFSDGPVCPSRGARKSRCSTSRTMDEATQAGRHISYTERRSEEAERELRQVKLLEVMQNHVGEQFNGVVASITNFGIFVQLQHLHGRGPDPLHRTARTTGGKSTRRAASSAANAAGRRSASATCVKVTVTKRGPSPARAGPDGQRSASAAATSGTGVQKKGQHWRLPNQAGQSEPAARGERESRSSPKARRSAASGPRTAAAGRTSAAGKPAPSPHRRTPVDPARRSTGAVCDPARVTGMATLPTPGVPTAGRFHSTKLPISAPG